MEKGPKDLNGLEIANALKVLPVLILGKSGKTLGFGAVPQPLRSLNASSISFLASGVGVTSGSLGGPP